MATVLQAGVVGPTRTEVSQQGVKNLGEALQFAGQMKLKRQEDAWKKLTDVWANNPYGMNAFANENLASSFADTIGTALGTRDKNEIQEFTHGMAMAQMSPEKRQQYIQDLYQTGQVAPQVLKNLEDPDAWMQKYQDLWKKQEEAVPAAPKSEAPRQPAAPTPMPAPGQAAPQQVRAPGLPMGYVQEGWASTRPGMASIPTITEGAGVAPLRDSVGTPLEFNTPQEAQAALSERLGPQYREAQRQRGMQGISQWPPQAAPVPDPTGVAKARISELDSQIASMQQAITSGIQDPTIGAQLAAAQKERASLVAQVQVAQPLPGAKVATPPAQPSSAGVGAAASASAPTTAAPTTGTFREWLVQKQKEGAAFTKEAGYAPVGVTGKMTDEQLQKKNPGLAAEWRKSSGTTQAPTVAPQTAAPTPMPIPVTPEEAARRERYAGLSPDEQLVARYMGKDTTMTAQEMAKVRGIIQQKRDEAAADIKTFYKARQYRVGSGDMQKLESEKRQIQMQDVITKRDQKRIDEIDQTLKANAVPTSQEALAQAAYALNMNQPQYGRPEDNPTLAPLYYDATDAEKRKTEATIQKDFASAMESAANSRFLDVRTAGYNTELAIEAAKLALQKATAKSESLKMTKEILLAEYETYKPALQEAYKELQKDPQSKGAQAKVDQIRKYFQELPEYKSVLDSLQVIKAMDSGGTVGAVSDAVFKKGWFGTVKADGSIDPFIFTLLSGDEQTFTSTSPAGQDAATQDTMDRIAKRKGL